MRTVSGVHGAFEQRLENALEGEGESARRAKLAANIRDGAKLVFINRRGIKVEEFDAHSLARALHRGDVKPIQDGALFDRALEAVIGDLRRLAGS